MITGSRNIPPGGVPVSKTLQSIKSELMSKAPQNKSGTINPNEFNVVDRTNSAEVKPVMAQNNLSAGSSGRGTTVDIKV